MDSSAKPFYPSPSGCNYCDTARSLQAREEGASSIDEVFADILRRRKSGANYDVIVGVSGGLDSSFLLHKACRAGLRVLAVHMDNCWNAATATHNLSKMVDKLEVDLLTYVVDWEIQKKMQLAFLNADVVDVDLLYDNALHEICYRAAQKYNVLTILGGANLASEGVEVARNWAWYPFDGRNIRGIARNSKVRVGDYPIFTFSGYLKSSLLMRIRWLSPLSRDTSYKREYALALLADQYGYKDYGNKHYENVFTRIYQGLILPEKFGIDKRKAHYSSLIVSGQMTRSEALALLSKPSYDDSKLRELDVSFFCERLDLSPSEFEQYLARPRREHREYGVDPIFLLFRLIMGLRRALIVRKGR